MVHRQRLYKDEVSEFCIGERIAPKSQEVHTALERIARYEKNLKGGKDYEIKLI